MGHGGVTGGSGRTHLTQGDVGCDELEYSLPTAGNPKAPAARKMTSDGLKIMLVNNCPGKILKIKNDGTGPTANTVDLFQAQQNKNFAKECGRP